MRVIKYPDGIKEKEVECFCGVRIGYYDGDCFFEDVRFGTFQCLNCPVCGKKLTLSYETNPDYNGIKAFGYSTS